MKRNEIVGIRRRVAALRRRLAAAEAQIALLNARPAAPVVLPPAVILPPPVVLPVVPRPYPLYYTAPSPVLWTDSSGSPVRSSPTNGYNVPTVTFQNG